MTLTLTPEQTQKLKAKANRAHKSMGAVLDDLPSDNTEILNGATYPIFSPHDNPGATPIMQEALADESSKKPEPINAKNLAMLALLQKWHDEDEAMTDEEIEQATRDYEELRTNLNLNRIRAGEEPLFP